MVLQQPQGFEKPGGETPVPGIGDADNTFISDVIGNKGDPAVTVPDSTASIVSMIKGLFTVIGGAPLDEVAIVVGPFGNVEVEDIDSAVRYAVYLIGLGTGAVLVNAQTTEGTFTVTRVRAGVSTVIVASTPSTEASGVVSAVIDFTTGAGLDWEPGDLGFIEFSGISVTIGGTTTSFPVLRRSFRVASIAVGDHTVPGIDSANNILSKEVIGNKEDGAVNAASLTASLVAYAKGILEAGVLATGTFTTSSATVPADTGRTEADNFFDGSFLIPLTGAVEDQPRQIAAFANTGGVFTLDSEHPFTSAPGLVAYVIVGSGSNLVPAPDSAANQTDAHVIGNKSDTVAGNSIYALLLQILAGSSAASDHSVPSADSVANALSKEAIGNKADTTSTVINATNSLVRMVKGVLSRIDVVLSSRSSQTSVNVIDAFHDVPGADAVTNAQMRDVIGNKADAVSFAINATNSLVRMVKGILTRIDVTLSSRSTQTSVDTVDAFHDVPSVDSADNLQMRDVIGNKGDTQTITLAVDKSLVSYLKGLANLSVLATGTFTTSSATVPADTGRTEGDGFFNGSFLIPLTGVIAFQPRQIASFANTGGVFTLDSELTFTAAPGLVEYVIVGAGNNLTPSADSAANQTLAHVVGNKLDTVAGNSVVALLKQLLAGGTNSETTGPFSYLDAGLEQVVHSNASTLRRRVSVWVSSQNMTADGDFRIFVRLDGVTFALFTEKRVLAAAGEEKVLYEEFTVNQDFEIRYEEAADEGANRAIPFEVIEEPLE